MNGLHHRYREFRKHEFRFTVRSASIVSKATVNEKSRRANINVYSVAADTMASLYMNRTLSHQNLVPDYPVNAVDTSCLKTQYELTIK